MWFRSGFYYVSRAEATIGEMRFSAEYRLGLVSYWFIRWIHGQDKLWKQSAQAYLNKELRMDLFQERS